MTNGNFETAQISVQRFRFKALVAGPVDGELVLFLHGFPEFGDAWCDVMQPVAKAGLRTVAVDQRGYSSEAQPDDMSDYGIEHLISGIEGFADALGRRHFHLVGHDWSAFLAWVFAAKHPDRVQSLSALSTPHPDALLNAIETDEDQRQRSRYISFFKMPGGAAESFLQADNYQRLRAVYQGKLSESEINENIRRLAQPGALSAALNWYRALDLDHTWCRLVRSRVIFDAGAPLYEKRPRNILNTFLRLSAVIRSFIRGTNSLWPETVCTSRKRS